MLSQEQADQQKLDILVIKHGALGDWIISTGAYHLIRQFHPHANIVLLTNSAYVGLAKQTMLFNNVWIDDRKNLLSFSTLRLFLKIKKAQFSIVYDIQCSHRTEIYRRLIKSKHMKWYGRTPDSEENYQGLSAPHIVERIRRRLAPAGITAFPTPDISWLTSMEPLAIPSPYIVIMPGCSSRHPEKQWTPRGYSLFIQAMAAKGYISILTGANTDSNIINQILAACTEHPPLNLLNKSPLPTLAMLCKNAEGALGSDSGPMHIAWLCCPSLVLCSREADAARYSSYGDNVMVLKKENLKDLEPNHVVECFIGLI